MKRLPALLAAVALLASCATLPERRSRDWMAALPPGDTLYLAARLDAFQDLLADLLPGGGKDVQLREALRRTERLYASLRLRPGAPPEMAAIALGDYPSGSLSWQLGCSPDWQRQGPGGEFWASRREPLQLALPERRLILVATAGMERLLALLRQPGPDPLPQAARRDMETSELIVFFPVLPDSGGAAGLSRLPIRRSWVTARPAGDGVAVGAFFGLEEVKNARILESLLRLAVVALLREQQLPDVAERLKGMEVTMEPSGIRLSGLRLSARETLGLIQALIGAGRG